MRKASSALAMYQYRAANPIVTNDVIPRARAVGLYRRSAISLAFTVKSREQ